jgi:hypothetical protein
MFNIHVQFFTYKMTVASENSMRKHRNVDLNTVSLKASDCTSTSLDDCIFSSKTVRIE